MAGIISAADLGRRARPRGGAGGPTSLADIFRGFGPAGREIERQDAARGALSRGGSQMPSLAQERLLAQAMPDEFARLQLLNLQNKQRNEAAQRLLKSGLRDIEANKLAENFVTPLAFQRGLENQNLPTPDSIPLGMGPPVLNTTPMPDNLAALSGGMERPESLPSVLPMDDVSRSIFTPGKQQEIEDYGQLREDLAKGSARAQKDLSIAIPNIAQTTLQNILNPPTLSKDDLLVLGADQTAIDPATGQVVARGSPKTTTDIINARYMFPGNDPEALTNQRNWLDAVSKAPLVDMRRALEDRAKTLMTEGIAKQDLEDWKTYGEKGITAQQNLRSLAATRAALESGRFQTGPGAELRATIAELASLGGVDISGIAVFGSPATFDIIDRESKTQALALLAQLEGLRGTNLALRITQDAVTSANRTPEGNRAIAALSKANSEQDLRNSEIVDDYINQFGSLRPDGLPTAQEKIIESNKNHEKAVNSLVAEILNSSKRAPDSWEEVYKLLQGQPEEDGPSEFTPEQQKRWKALQEIYLNN